MSPNNAPQNQNAGSQDTSQKPAPEPKASRLKEAYKAASKLFRKCWSKLRAFLGIVRALLSILWWEATNILKYLFGVLAEARVPIIFGLFGLFLHQPIEQLAVKRLVAPLLAHFDTGVVPSYTMLVLALCFALYTLLLWSRLYVVGRKWLLTALLVLLGYCYYRCNPQGLQAIAPFRFALLFDGAWPSYLSSRVTILQPQRWAFADIIPFTCILLLLVWGFRYGVLVIKRLAQIRRCSWTSIRDGITSWVEKLKKRYAPFVREQTRKQARKVEGFLTDHPLSEEEEELSGWTSQAQTLTQKLLATDTTRAAFSLGIVASWGEGKSSFMGIMQRYLQQARQEVIVMHFNPWLYDKEAQLTKVFFEELRRTLAPYSSKLSKSIDNYADLLLAVDSSWLKFAHQLLRLSQRSTTEQFAQLSRDIKELGRRVVIFIDDVDRLTREELMELFNLVRNSSNLPCLYFVLAYDKSYVLKTLQSDGEHMTRYPEKILQEEYPLPKLTPDKMWTVLEQCLNKTQFGKGNYMLVQQPLNELKGKGVNLPYHLTTIRMVKRMVNAFNSRYELLHSLGINTRDLFIFELIYYVYPSVYDLLLEMHKKALTRLNVSTEKRRLYSSYSLCPIFFSHTNAKGMRYISLHPEGEASSDSYNEASWNPYPIVDALKKLDFGLKDGYKEDMVVENIVELLDLLWGKEREPVLGQINHETYWRRYFYRGLQVGELSSEEFDSFLANLDRSERRQCLERWSQEKPIAFMQEVLGYSKLQQTQWEGLIQNKMETIVYAMFDWNTLASKDMAFDRTEIDALIRRVNLSDNLKRALLLEVLRDKQIREAAFDYTRAWLWGRGHELFTIKTPAPIEAAKDKSTLLSRVDLVGVQVDIFNSVALGHTSIPDLYMLWWLRCGIREGDRIKRAPEIDQTMRECIEKDIEGFLQYALSGPRDNTYVLLDIPWKNLTEFDEYLSKYSENPYVANFREFLSIALEREQELKQEAPVIIKIEPEQWIRMPRSNFGSRTIYALDEDYPFYSTPPEEHED